MPRAPDTAARYSSERPNPVHSDEHEGHTASVIDRPCSARVSRGGGRAGLYAGFTLMQLSDLQ
jgi:hypothetical protein